MITCLIVSTWSPTLASKCTASLGFVETSREPTLKISRSPWIGSKSYRVSIWMVDKWKSITWRIQETVWAPCRPMRQCSVSVLPRVVWVGDDAIRIFRIFFMADFTVLKECDIQVLKLANFLRVSVSTMLIQHPKIWFRKNINTFIRKFGIRE